MKRNKIMLVGTAALAALLTAGCQKSNNSAKVSSSTGSASVSKASDVKKVHHTSSQAGNLSANDLSPKETVAVVTAYASKKYGDNWSDLCKDAKKSNLEVDFLTRDKHPKINKGQGYIYDVGSKDYTFETRYTLEGNGSSQVIYFYEGNDYLGSSTISDIVAYLNKNDGEDLVDELEDGAVIGGETDSSDDSDSDTKKGSDSDDSKSSSSLPGDAGLFTTPGNMRGGWLYYDGDNSQILNISAHELSTNDMDVELHKQKSNFDSKGLDTEKYGHYYSASNYGALDMPAIAVRPWTQQAGASEVFARTTAKGQPVMIHTNSNGRGVEVYWKSKSVAEKYKDKTFDSLDDFNDWK